MSRGINKKTYTHCVIEGEECKKKKCALYKKTQREKVAEASDGWRRKGKGVTTLFAILVIIVYRFGIGCSFFPNRSGICDDAELFNISVLFRFFFKKAPRTGFNIDSEYCVLFQPYKWCLFITKSHLVSFLFFLDFVLFIHLLFQEHSTSNLFLLHICRSKLYLQTNEKHFLQQ